MKNVLVKWIIPKPFNSMVKYMILIFKFIFCRHIIMRVTFIWGKSSTIISFTTLLQFCHVTTHEWWNHRVI